jgi:aminoglycoside phosphotransferase family enzyme
MIAKLILLITTAHAIYSHSQQDIIREKHGDLYLGEAFLSAD